MPEAFDRIAMPERGEVVAYDGGFHSSEAPIVPIAHGDDDNVVPAARRVFDTAAERMGRTISWLRVYVGVDARERYGVPLPADTIRALRLCRLGLVGSLASNPAVARVRERELRRRVGLTAAVDRCERPEWAPSSIRAAGRIDVTVFRDVTEDAFAGLGYAPEAAGTDGLRQFLQETADETGHIPVGPTGFSVRPISARATESLVDLAMEYALDRDRDVITIVHQGDLLPASEGSFLAWARAHLADAYGDATVDEETYLHEYDGRYPADEVVVTQRRTDVVCREVLTDPDAHDVLVCPALAGTYVSAVAAESAGGFGVTPVIAIGEGRLLAGSRPPIDSPTGVTESNPIGTMLSGCLLFEYIGWTDVASTVRNAISATLADGTFPRALVRRSRRGRPVTAPAFAEAVVDHLDGPERTPTVGGVETTADERSAIKRTIAGVYNVVFDDHLDPGSIELNQLLGVDEEADIYLPEVGLNFHDWRRWSPERRLEVLLHELAHIEEETGEPDHGVEFYDRLVELTEIAAEWRPELEGLFGTPLDFDRVRRHVVESVHEGTIEPDVESVRERKRLLRDRLGLTEDEHY